MHINKENIRIMKIQKKKKRVKKGFTLLELLAVIIVLAIIALITIPVVIKIVEKSEKGAFEDTAYGLIRAAKIYYAEESLESRHQKETFSFPEDKKLKLSGKKPESGTLVLHEDGKVALAVQSKKWCAIKEKVEEKVRIIEYDEETCVISESLAIQKEEIEKIAKEIVEKAGIYHQDGKAPMGETFTYPEDTKLGLTVGTPSGGTAVLESEGNISMAVHNDKWCAIKERDEDTFKIIKYEEGTCKTAKSVITEKYSNGKAVYYNPQTNKKCTAAEAVSTTGTKTGCMKWYTFLDKEGNTDVNILLDHHTTTHVLWSTIKTQLAKDGASWQKKPRLIRADEIAKITGADVGIRWDSSLPYSGKNVKPTIGKNINQFVFVGSFVQDKGCSGCDVWQNADVYSGTSPYAWLYDYMLYSRTFNGRYDDNTEYAFTISGESKWGKITGYFTSTPVTSMANYVWEVSRDGRIEPNYTQALVGWAGIRPVITVSKSTIS